MSFSRVLFPAHRPTPDQLSRQMAGLGMSIAAAPDVSANIEDVLYFASHDRVGGDLRTLRVLTNWLEVHYPIVLVDRLTRLVQGTKRARFRAYWAAVAMWLGQDNRFRRLSRVYDSKRFPITEGIAFQLQRDGENPRFVDGPLVVPTTLLAPRDGDVAPPQQVARFHPHYPSRVQMGATYRADMWAELKAALELSAAELARRCYGAFVTAWRAKTDFNLLLTASRLR